MGKPYETGTAKMAPVPNSLPPSLVVGETTGSSLPGTVLAPACCPCKIDNQSSFHCPLRVVWTLDRCPTCSRHCKPMWLQIQCFRWLLPISHSSTLTEIEIRWIGIQIKLRVQYEKNWNICHVKVLPSSPPFPLNCRRKS